MPIRQKTNYAAVITEQTFHQITKIAKNVNEFLK